MSDRNRCIQCGNPKPESFVGDFCSGECEDKFETAQREDGDEYTGPHYREFDE